MRLRVEIVPALVALALLVPVATLARSVESAPDRAGPAGDFPVVVGDPYVINGITFTPVDTMNYDALGRAIVGSAGGSAVSAAHHTLPLPSYVEVTALESGRTILVRVERRGPVDGTDLIELSPGAAAQLGIVGQAKAAVRVRRVNPVEPERALLREGQPAPARIDTPRSLLNVLQRRLAAQEGDAMTAAFGPPPAQVQPAPQATPAPVAAPPARPSVAATVKGGLVIQVGAFSSKANAQTAATKTGGKVEAAGKLWRVRAGPFASRAEAEAALARAKKAGFGDAAIRKAD